MKIHSLKDPRSEFLLGISLSEIAFIFFILLLLITVYWIDDKNKEIKKKNASLESIQNKNNEINIILEKNKKYIKKIIQRLKKYKIRVSLFIEPNIIDIKLSQALGANCVELHTGQFCNMINKNKKTVGSYLKLKKSANYAKKIGLEVHAGHGLTYKSALKISKIKNISEFNIGHFIISESLFVGLRNTIKKFKTIINT